MIFERVRSLIRNLFRRPQVEQDLDDEVRAYVEMIADEKVAQGMTVEEARRAARVEMGGVESVKEEVRTVRIGASIETLWQDVRFGIRTLLKTPGVTFVVILSLALGIGANTAIFTLIEAVMLRSLPVEAPNELVSVGNPARPSGVSIGGPRMDIFSYPLYLRLRDENQVFTGLLASGRTGHLAVRIGSEDEESVRGRLVSGNYFEVLGVQPSIGRAFTAEEDRANPVVVISDGYWESRFSRDPTILGRTLSLNGSAFTVIGVGPRDFTGEVVGSPTDIWIPISMQGSINRGDSRLTRTDASWLLCMGRLKPGATLSMARTEIRTLVQEAVKDFKGGRLSADQVRSIEVQPSAKGFSYLRKRLSQPLSMLMVVVGVLLLIACANVANLLLARATSRGREISVRLAMGASRGRLIRQLLTESILLASLGGLAGALLAQWGTSLLVRLAVTGSDPLPLDVSPNPMVLTFAAGISILTGILFGLVPALRSTRVDLVPGLKENVRRLRGSGFPMGKALVIGQVSLSLLLLIGAGLFIRSLAHLETRDVGYSRENLSVLTVDLAASGYPAEQRMSIALRLIEHLQSIPGVTGVTVSENGIFNGSNSSTDGLQVEGFTPVQKGDLTSHFDQVGPHYFRVVGVPVLAGRDFDERDTVKAPNVVILNETMARFYFGKSDPIGKLLRNGGDRYTIIGIVKDMKERDLKATSERRFFLPLLQSVDQFTELNFEIRARGDTSTVSAIRNETRQFDRNLRVLELEPVRTLIDRSINDERLIARLCGFFSVLALMLAATGLYGVMAYTTARRVNEIGIRMALGADRRGVVFLVLRETMMLVIVGLGIGLMTSIAVGRLIAANLAGVSASDSMTLVFATVVMLVVGISAGLIPAMRASRVDPMVALRQE